MPPKQGKKKRACLRILSHARIRRRQLLPFPRAEYYLELILIDSSFGRGRLKATCGYSSIRLPGHRECQSIAMIVTRTGFFGRKRQHGCQVTIRTFKHGITLPFFASGKNKKAGLALGETGFCLLFRTPLSVRNSKKKLTSLLPKEEAGNHLHKETLCGIQKMLHKSILKIPTPENLVNYQSPRSG